ncbi:LysR family transcriptional regulator [Marisediminicola sp. LYQ85]|uniref:helix-turn-helix domain-containing protein n=1 Tax=Marisediminicola sp. LYQ85 TaxID=3391062 RepID=UPI0039839357
MNPIVLRHFVAAAEHLHFAHAAKAERVPRSTLIASVRELERMLGTALFDTDAATTTLTPAGADYLVEARRQLDASAAAARASRPAPGGKAKASKGKGRAPAVKGQPRVGKRRQSR